MRLLLDTHTFLWFAFGDARLSPKARGLIEGAEDEKLLSVVSVWETCIKVGTGKLQLTAPPGTFFRRALAGGGIGLLPIEISHAAAVSTLPFHHRDPFDRLIFAQSLTESMPLISVDAIADAYGVTRLWD